MEPPGRANARPMMNSAKSSRVSGLSPRIETPHPPSLREGTFSHKGRRENKLGATDMAYKNFKVETDADGIVLVTWDIPGRSMNVLDETTMTELGEIVKQTSADAAVKGVVITSAKEAFSAGADLSMLEGMAHRYAEALKAKGEIPANQML